MGSTSEKYLTALHYQNDTRVKILVPHWFDDVVRLGVSTVPTIQYEWPDPKVLQLAPPSQEGKRGYKPPEDKASLYKSIVLGTSEDTKFPENMGKAAERVDVWKGKRILLSVSLELSPGRRSAVVAGVKRFGGVVVDAESANDEAKKVENVDVLITKFRAGAAYFKVIFPPLKRIPCLTHSPGLEMRWSYRGEPLLAVPCSNYQGHPTTNRPASPLPHPQQANRRIQQARGFNLKTLLVYSSLTRLKEITVTNYTGEAREYLKRLIEVMGARFTPNMSSQNTVVIAA